MSNPIAPPRVCIGLPVYNGEASLEEALESVLAQTYDDFELLICDNDSSDRTQEICERYAARDSRVRYTRNDGNIGAAPNFNKTFELNRSEYFKWMAHDDLIEPAYLESCVRALDEAPSSVSMVFPRRIELNHVGELIRYDPFQPAEALEGAWEGFHSLSFSELVGLENRDIPPAIFGLVRSEALAETRLIQGFIGSDRACVSELCLRGQVWQTPDFHFKQRFHADDSWRRKLSNEENAEWYDPANRGRKVRPSWELFVNLLVNVRHSPLGPLSRARHYVVVVFYHWVPRAYRTLRYQAWRLWARSSLFASRASKVTTIPLRAWIGLRRARRDGLKRVPASLAASAAMDRNEVIEQAAQMLTDRGEVDDLELVRAWAEDSDETYRNAAQSALSYGGHR
ncbi:MAG: glycosyltransferase family 2 protein [Polyangiales bacterium]